jgi:hypothetical protein
MEGNKEDENAREGEEILKAGWKVEKKSKQFEIHVYI